MREAAAVGAYLLAVGAALGLVAAERPLWYDELFTLYLAKPGPPSDLWNHLAAGTDLNPPLSYVLARWSMAAFGGAEWAIRVPSILGGLLCGLCVYLFVRRRRGVAEAWVALAALTLSDVVWMFFQEARPYGLMCGWSALALLCWQRAAEPGATRGWALGLGAALGLGMLTHYYFALVVVALGVGEAVRTWQRRRIDFWMVGAFGVSLVALAACHPLWSSAAKTYSGGWWSKTTFSANTILRAYGDLLTPTAGIVAGVGVAIAVAGRMLRHRTLNAQSGHGVTGPQKRHELAAVVVLAVLPVLGVLLSATVTGAFYYRYVMPAAIGWAILLAWGLGWIGRHSSGAAAVVAVAFGGCFFANLPSAMRHERAKATNEVWALREFLNQHASGATVVTGNPLFFLQQAHHRGEAGFAPIYPADQNLAIENNFPDTADRGLLALSRIRPVPVVPFTDVAAAIGRGERVYCFEVGDDWQTKQLRKQGVRFEPVAEYRSGKLYRLTR